MYQEKATILKNKEIGRDIYELTLDIPKIASIIQPGQFLHFKINDATDPLLRRPLSVNRLISKKNNSGFLVVVIYKVVGKGTALLAGKYAGYAMDVLGPLGNGFLFGKLNAKYKQVIIVSGGMGIAPLVFLTEKLRLCGEKAAVFIGAANKNEIICVDILKKSGCEVKISTDDGSMGFKGYVSELVREYLSNPKTLVPKSYIYACGPLAMLRELNKIVCEYNLEGQVSVDKMLGCGVGACLGCVIKTKNYKSKIKNDFVYKRICKDGPVFDIKEIVWEE